MNDSVNTNDDFEEVLLYDGGYQGSNVSNGGINQTNNTNFKNIVYASIIEEDAHGYRGNADNQTYDFQMLLPEVGLSSWTSSTPYYFYVELS